MVKIAIAGGSGNVAAEIIDALLAANKHEIMLLSRKVSYDDIEQTAKALDGVETVLSFINEMESKKPTGQKNLIDASIRAGVKRFSPSEWGSSGVESIAWYAYKKEIRDYLAEVNKDKKVLEYCIFQPGLFTNYITYPHQTSKHFQIWELSFNFEKRRAMVREGGEDDLMTLTTIEDLAAVVAQAIDYEGEWPVIGGIKGQDITVSELNQLGERICGPMTVDKLKTEDLEAGIVNSTWLPDFSHPNVPPEKHEEFQKPLICGLLLSHKSGSWLAGNDEWNKRLPNHKFTTPEELLKQVFN